MYMLLAGLKDYFRRQEIVTDNVVFRLHYIFTTVLLIAFSVLVTASQVIVTATIKTSRTYVYVYRCYRSTLATLSNASMTMISQSM